MNVLAKKWFRKGPVTAAANTPYLLGLDPGMEAGRVIVNRLTITVGVTGHNLSVMQVHGRDKATAGGAANQAKFKIAEANAAGIAANDYLGITAYDGSIIYGKVSAVAAASGGEIEITMTANLGKVVEKGARIYFFALPSENETVALADSATTTIESDYGYFGANEMGDPLLLYVDNATNASTLDACVGQVIAC